MGHLVKICDKNNIVNEANGTMEVPRCSICCEDLTDTATELPCGHLYNKECISQWLNEHNQCPVCRFELKTDDLQYE